MTLATVALYLTLLTLAALLWQHLNIGQRAFRAAKRRTEEAGVILLDQSVILTKVALRRSTHSLFALERRYNFEFSTRGDIRYSGYIVLIGRRVTDFYLTPFHTFERFESIEESYVTSSCGCGSRCQK